MFRIKDLSIEDECHIKWNTFIQKKDEVADVDENTESGVPVAILHTGGTTGTPKGVMISNESFNTIAYQYKLSGMYLFPGQRFLDIMPPFIAYGVGAGLHMPFVVGMTAILIPKFEPKDFARMIIKMKPNHMAGVPSHWGNILESKEMKNADLSFLITPAVGGDGMNIKLEKKANVFLKQHRAPNSIIKGYGLTERESIHQRQAEGIAAAKAKGKHLGRQASPLPDGFEEICAQCHNGKVSIRAAAAALSMSRTTFYRHFLDWEQNLSVQEGRLSRTSLV